MLSVLALDTELLLDTCYVVAFLTFFVIIYLVLLASRLQECFKQGRIWQIRVSYIIISMITSYLVVECIQALADNFLSF